MQYSDDLKTFAKSLPTLPGVYKFLNQENTIIYIGKAKSLRNRVVSYFNPSSQQQQFKTQLLIKEIRQIDYVVVNTEVEALLLENNFIKAHQPKYNILLKDDKSYPYICVSEEPYPRLFIANKLEKKGLFFGPYTHVKRINSILELVKKLYQIRSCSLNLNSKNVAQKKYPLCLEYHLKNCKGPCQNLQTIEAYNEDIAQIIQLLKGKIGYIKQIFTENMQQASQKLNFELAQSYKEKIDSLSYFQEKSLVSNPNIPNIEVYTIRSNEIYAYVNFLKIIHGSVIFSQNVEIKKKLDESDEDILSLCILNLRQKFTNLSDLIMTNIALENVLDEVEIKVPKIGNFKKLVDLSFKNIDFFIKNQLFKKEQAAQNQKRKRSLVQLKSDLNLKNLPMHIECFDNSNLQGTNPVASMVYFKNGKPTKKEYRHYNIKTVEGIDDFASMYEVVSRRYTRLIDEEKELPNLIVVDGGKGQLSSASKALQDLDLDIPIIGIAKRLEEIYRPNQQLPLLINKQSVSLALLQRIRNEAHRFAITFHRDKRSLDKKQHSRLTDLEGIGEKTLQTLYGKYKSFEKIKAAPIFELNKLIGEARAEKVRTYIKDLEIKN